MSPRPGKQLQHWPRDSHATDASVKSAGGARWFFSLPEPLRGTPELRFQTPKASCSFGLCSLLEEPLCAQWAQQGTLGCHREKDRAWQGGGIKQVISNISNLEQVESGLCGAGAVGAPRGLGGVVFSGPPGHLRFGAVSRSWLTLAPLAHRPVRAVGFRCSRSRTQVLTVGP